MAQSLFKALKQQDEQHEIDVLAPAWSKPLLERMPEVNRAIDMPLGHGKMEFKTRWQLGARLRGLYDQAILLPNSWKSAIIPFAARIPQRTGWVGEMRYGLLNDIRRLDKSRLTMTVQRFVALADSRQSNSIPEIIPPRLEVKEKDLEKALDNLGLIRPEGCSLLHLCPGAEYGEAKRWPTEYYAELARQHIANGGLVWLFGSEKDKQVCAAIQARAGEGCIDLSGRTSLAEAVDLLSLADGVVSNDSGLMHVAAALDRKLVAIYGSSDPGFTPPLNRQHKIVSLGLECSPCFKRECPLGHLRCLRDISVQQVIDALQELQE